MKHRQQYFVVNTAREVKTTNNLNQSYMPTPRFDNKITSNRTQKFRSDQTSIFVDLNLPPHIKTHGSIFTKFDGIGMQLKSSYENTQNKEKFIQSRNGIRLLRKSNINDIILSRNTVESKTLEEQLRTHEACIDQFYQKGLQSAREQELNKIRQKQQLIDITQVDLKQNRTEEEILSQLYKVHFKQNIKTIQPTLLQTLNNLPEEHALQTSDTQNLTKQKIGIQSPRSKTAGNQNPRNKLLEKLTDSALFETKKITQRPNCVKATELDIVSLQNEAFKYLTLRDDTFLKSARFSFLGQDIWASQLPKQRIPERLQIRIKAKQKFDKQTERNTKIDLQSVITPNSKSRFKQTIKKNLKLKGEFQAVVSHLSTTQQTELRVIEPSEDLLNSAVRNSKSSDRQDTLCRSLSNKTINLQESKNINSSLPNIVAAVPSSRESGSHTCNNVKVVNNADSKAEFYKVVDDKPHFVLHSPVSTKEQSNKKVGQTQTRPDRALQAVQKWSSPFQILKTRKQTQLATLNLNKVKVTERLNDSASFRLSNLLILKPKAVFEIKKQLF